MVRGAEDFASSAFNGTPLERAGRIADGLTSLYEEAYTEFSNFVGDPQAASAATNYVNDVFGDLALLDNGGVPGENVLDAAAGAFVIEHAADFGVTPGDKFLSVEDLQVYLGDDPVDTAEEHFVQRIINDLQSGEFHDDTGEPLSQISVDDLKDYVLLNMIDPRIMNKKEQPVKTNIASNRPTLPQNPIVPDQEGPF